jgi:hypothetical protein
MAKRNFRKLKRSGFEKCPICEKCLPLVEHHLHGRNISNETVWICASCHDLTHLGTIILLGMFQTTMGKELFWHYGHEDSPLPEVKPARPPIYKD